MDDDNLAEVPCFGYGGPGVGPDRPPLTCRCSLVDPGTGDHFPETREEPEMLGEKGRVDYRYAFKGGLSFLVDNTILLRYVEIESTMQRAMVVLKMRGSDHAKEIRRYEIGVGGLRYWMFSTVARASSAACRTGRCPDQLSTVRSRRSAIGLAAVCYL